MEDAVANCGAEASRKNAPVLRAEEEQGINHPMSVCFRNDDDWSQMQAIGGARHDRVGDGPWSGLFDQDKEKKPLSVSLSQEEWERILKQSGIGVQRIGVEVAPGGGAVESYIEPKVPMPYRPSSDQLEEGKIVVLEPSPTQGSSHDVSPYEWPARETDAFNQFEEADAAVPELPLSQGRAHASPDERARIVRAADALDTKRKERTKGVPGDLSTMENFPSTSPPNDHQEVRTHTASVDIGGDGFSTGSSGIDTPRVDMGVGADNEVAHNLPVSPGAYAVQGPGFEGRDQARPQNRQSNDGNIPVNVPFEAHTVMENVTGQGRGGGHLSAFIRQSLRQDDLVIDGVAVDRMASSSGQDAASSKSRMDAMNCISSVRSMIILTLVIICAVGAITGILVSRSSNAGNNIGGNDHGSSSDDLVAPSAMPSGSPTSERFGIVKSIVEGLSKAKLLNDPSTPQFQALLWLTDEDGLLVDWRNTQDLVERYALATLYFSTSGEESWIHQCGFLSNVHHCLWNEKVQDPDVDFEIWGVLCSEDGNTVNGIHLPMNNLSGTIPEEISLLFDLTLLYLQGNELVGAIPETVCFLDYLNQVSLMNNALTGTIPSCIGDLLNLRYLFLGENLLSGKIPSGIGNLRSLEYLWLFINELTGQMPESLGNLVELKDLYLAANKLNGTIVPSINNLTKIERLFFELNDLTGTMPLHHGSFPNLFFIDFSRSFVSGTIPTALFSYPNLLNIDLYGALISGTLPEEIGNLPRLDFLGLDQNMLTGSIPSTIGLTNLRTLGLGFNNMNGTIPSSVGNWQHMNWFTLEQNLLTGSIPSSMGNMTTTKNLILRHSSLSGTIPKELGELSEIKWLSLDHNSLNGTLPTTFAKFKDIHSLWVGGNNLSGDLNFLCNLSIPFLSADCFGLSPKVLCKCCQECCDMDGVCSAQ